MQDMGTFDYVIVGAGSAGAVLAHRLVAAGHTVAVVEAGGRDTYPWIHVPVGYLYCIGNPLTDWGFRTRVEPGLGDRSILYPRGRVLGGCSSINGMIYMRGQAADYDGWRQMGLTGWGWEDVLPLFKRAEDHVDGPSQMHGAGGEWRVERPRTKWEILDAFAAAAQAAGIPASDDFNTGTNEGVGYYQVNQKAGWRWNTAKAYLRPAGKGLTLLTHCPTRRVAFDGDRAVGVVVFRDGAEHLVRARAEVILSAGSIGTPHILQHSGIGPGAVLRAQGVEVRRDVPGIGANLQDHLQIRCAFRVSGVPTLNVRAGSLAGKLGIALEYALKRAGPMSMAPSQLGAFARSRPDVATPDLQYHVQPLSLEAFGGDLHPFPAFTASVCNLRPESRGHVQITSPRPEAAPEIAPNYLSAEADRITAANAIRLTRRIAAQAPLAQYSPEEFKPGPEVEGDGPLAEAAGRIGTTIFHPVGTAAMGVDDSAPVTPDLRLRGVDGLRIVDASVMPRIPSGNTAAPTMMIAERAADLILKA